VVPETADEVSVDALLDFARGRLPAYMVPGIVKVIDSIPLNANGKVNRKALPPLGQDGAGAVDRTAPRTATEETLIRIWQELLETDAGFGVHSDFFQLGGHSLLATRLMWRVGEELNVTIASHILFEASTVAELALRVDAARLSSALVASDISQSAAETIEF
jgi:acyl carrier protein